MKIIVIILDNEILSVHEFEGVLRRTFKSSLAGFVVSSGQIANIE